MTLWDLTGAEERTTLYDELIDILALSTHDFNEKADFTPRQLWLLKELAFGHGGGSFCDCCEEPQPYVMMYEVHDPKEYQKCPEKETIDKMNVEWYVCSWCVNDRNNEVSA